MNINLNADIRTINKKALIVSIIILILLAGNVFLGIKCFLQGQENTLAKKQIINQEQDNKIISFLNLFILKVLKADGEVSFEDRLQLENDVRNLKNEEILNQWERFTESSSEEQVQIEVKNLLELLVKNIIK